MTLISTVECYPAAGIRVIAVESAGEMKKAVEEAVVAADALIMAAAVADYQVEQVSGNKIKSRWRPFPETD